MFMRREMSNMWRGLTWSYDHLGVGFDDLLTRNKNLKPMVASSRDPRRAKAGGKVWQ